MSIDRPPRAVSAHERGLSARAACVALLVAAASGTAAESALAGPGDENVLRDHPKRRAGLWEIRSVGAQASGLAPTRFCVGARTDTAASHLDRSVGRRGSCEFGAFQRAGDAWLAESVCRESRTVVTSRSVATGDFVHAYRIDTVVHYDPPLAGVRREDKDALEARWLGACHEGQRPGDMVVPGMGTLNMVDGSFRAESPARQAEPKPGATRRARARSAH